ncbi:RHS repeat protein [Lysobacter silvisoli]|uniref:RHS repeat protein n=2 Tax=Lysobacter silvisoli TaxID=2293254 RepID=A0A371JYT3_9GAMM|nr:RHS repeat protein [Lysobacter silvisoli]
MTLASTDGSLGYTTHANYSGDRLNWSIDQQGSRTTYVYTNWRQTSRTEGMDFWGTVIATTRTIQTDWNAPWAAPSERRTYNNANVLVGKSTWTYNTRGQPLTATSIDPATPTNTRSSTTTYCEQADITAGTCPLLGLVTAVNGPRTDLNDTTTYTYYASDDASCTSAPATCPHRKGDLWKVTNALGQVVETLAYDGAGRPRSVKDANGVVTDLEYHPRGWLAASKVRGPNAGSETDDAITRYTYTPTGLVSQITQPDGAYTVFGYDAAHRLTSITDNAGNQIVYTLDNAGSRTREDTKDSGGALKRTLSRVYNQLGQLKTGKDAYNHATGYVYDAAGNLDTTTDAQGTVTDNAYDPLGRLTQTLQDTAGINANTQFQYDALDRLTKVTDPKGLHTQYQYNGLGDLTQLTSPDTGVTTYSYDAAGNRTGQTDARAVASGYQYDALNRLTAVTYPTASLNVAYSYDTAQASCTTGETYTQGRLTRMSDASGQTDYCYDRFGNLVRKTTAFATGTTLATRYSYALGGALTGIVYPDGTAVDYQRDAQGRISEVGYTPVGGSRQRLVHNVQYAAFGPVTAWTYDNGRVLQRLYDQNYAPTRVADTSGSGLYVDFTLDNVSRISELRNRSNALDARYRYDALSRLDQLQDGPSGTPIETYTYDATGNRTGKTTSAGTAAYTYPSTSHRLSTVGGVVRTYSDNGNTTSVGGTALQLSYDDSNRLVQTQVNNAVVMNYAYNGRGEQVRRYLGANSKLSVYDEAGQWLGEYDGATPLQQVIWLDNYPVGLLVGSGAAQKLHYIQPDHLGTPREVIDPQRNVSVWKWQLKGEAFGASPPEQDPDLDGTSFVFDLRYPGQRYDAASGLNYNYFRDYEAAVGRYSTSDPIGLNGGLNTYLYSDANPFLIFDQYGLLGQMVAQGVCELITGTGGYWHKRKEDHFKKWSSERRQNVANECTRIYWACQSPNAGPSCVPDAVRACEAMTRAVDCELEEEKKTLNLVDPVPWWDIVGQLCNLGIVGTKAPRGPVP